jgi:ParB family chromosome partitioning protein
MLGKGLESLIPKIKKDSESNQEFTKEAVSNSGSAPSKNKGLLADANLPQSPNSHKPTSDLGDSSKIFDRPAAPASTAKYFSEAVFQIEIEKIKPNPYQPRRHFDEVSIKELAQSIREFGILQPLVVSKLVKETDSGAAVEYQLVAGERRLMAAKLLGLPRVPAIVKQVDEHRLKLELALIENIQRSDLNPIEEAKAYARLQDEFGLTQREIAVRVGKSREAVANTIRLLNLPLRIQEALAQGKLSSSQARMLLSISDPQEQDRTFMALLSQKVTVREMKQKTAKPQPVDPESDYWRKRFEEKFGAPVKLVKSGPRGKVILQFYSEEEWQNIISKIFGADDL